MCQWTCSAKAPMDTENEEEPRPRAQQPENEILGDGSKTQQTAASNSTFDVGHADLLGGDATSEERDEQAKEQIQPPGKRNHDTRHGIHIEPEKKPKDLRPIAQAATKTGIEADDDQSLPKQEPSRTSLDDLQHRVRFRTTHGASPEKANQIPLPPSAGSSYVSLGSSKIEALPAGRSLEQLTLRPEDIPLPDPVIRKKAEPSHFSKWVAGLPSKPKKKSKKAQAPPPPLESAPEVRAYRANITRLASHFSFENINTTESRHNWSSRIVFFDHLESSGPHVPARSEPWRSRTSPPPYQEFYRVLKTVSDNCLQRIIIVEDLTPLLIDLLGATFQIPPHVFEEHLDRSGYRMSESRNKATSWNTRSSGQGYSSITWFRPVLPLIPITPRFRLKLITNQRPMVRSIFDESRRRNVRLETLANIWRRYLDLCPEPGTHYQDSRDPYPVGWEERATIWTRDFDGCKFGKDTSPKIFFLSKPDSVSHPVARSLASRYRREHRFQSSEPATTASYTRQSSCKTRRQGSQLSDSWSP